MTLSDYWSLITAYLPKWGSYLAESLHNYYAYYEHVGEAYTLFGLGHQKLDLDFGGPLKFTLPLPFPHGPDGYKDMLIEARKRQERLWRPVQNLAKTIQSEQREQLVSLERRVAELQKAVEKLQK